MKDFNIIMEEFLKTFVREEVIKVYRSLLNKVNVSEFELAEELNLNINAVRNILYSLHQYNMVYSTRKKDKEKGWYIYYWTFNIKYAKGVLLKKKKEMLEEIKKRILDEESRTFYRCPDGHVRISVDEAMEHGFRCVDCEKILVEEGKESIESMKKMVEQLKEDIKVIERYVIKEIEEIEEKKKKIKKRPRKKKTAKKKPAKKAARKGKKKKTAKKKRKTSPRKKTPSKGRSSRKKRIKGTKKGKKRAGGKKSILGKIRKKVRMLSF